MLAYHLLALIPLFILFICSMKWYGRGLVHLTGFAYTSVLAFIAITQVWELLFLPLLLGTAIIQLILFVWSMMNGDWL